MNAEQLSEYRLGLGIVDALSVSLADSDPLPQGEVTALRKAARHFARAAALHDPIGCWFCEQLAASQPEATREPRDDFMHITAPCSASWNVPVPPGYPS